MTECEHRKTVVETEHLVEDKEDLPTALTMHLSEWKPTPTAAHPVTVELLSFKDGKLVIRTSQA